MLRCIECRHQTLMTVITMGQYEHVSHWARLLVRERRYGEALLLEEGTPETSSYHHHQSLSLSSTGGKDRALKHASRRLHTYVTAIMSLLLLALVVVLQPAFAQPPNTNSAGVVPQYVVTDLGTLGGCCSYAQNINAPGQVVGSSNIADNLTRAFRWSNGVMTDLGSFGGSYSTALGINDSGDVVGVSKFPDDHFHAFLWNSGGMTDLGTLGGTNSGAWAINTSGQIAGYSSTADGREHAFRYSNGVMTDLGSLGGNSTGNDMNASGQVVGMSYTASHVARAFLWSDSDGVMSDLGTLGGSWGYAIDINDAGQVVGWSAIAGESGHAFLWSGGVMSDLGTLGGGTSQAISINASGKVVGWSRTVSNSQHAFLYSSGGMQDLNDFIPADSGWELTFANGINDMGQIVGWGSINGQMHAFLLTPAREGIEGLIEKVRALVAAGVLNGGQGNGLIAKLEAALQQLDHGNTKTAVNQLQAFVNEMNAFISAGTVSTAQGQPLIDGATAIIAGLQSAS